MAQKTHYLSLEYIIGDKTYWLTSDHVYGKTWSFSEIPLSFFGENELYPNEIKKESPYSSMTFFDDGTVSFSCIDDQDSKFILRPEFLSLNWEEMAILIREKLSLSAATPFYHNHWLVKKPTCKYNIPDGFYRVTAFLPEQGKLAIMHYKWNPPENTSWITFDLPTEASFEEALDQFYINCISNGNRLLPVLDTGDRWTPDKVWHCYV